MLVLSISPQFRAGPLIRPTLSNRWLGTLLLTIVICLRLSTLGQCFRVAVGATLRGPLEAVQRGEMPFGPLGNRIRADSSHAGYARATLDDLDSQLVAMGFEILSKVRQYLTELDPKKAEIFMALMRDQRAQRCLVQSTMAFPSLVGLDNVDELLEVVRLSTAEDVRASAEQREAALKRAHDDALESLARRHSDEELARKSEILRLEQFHVRQKEEAEKSVELRDGQIGDLSLRLSEIEIAANADIDQRIQKAVSSAKNVSKLLKFALIVVYLIPVGVAYWYAPTDKTILFFVVTLILAALGLWTIPDFIFDLLRRPLWRWRFQGRCEELQVSQHLPKFLIDDSDERADRL